MLNTCVLAYNKSPCRRQTIWVPKIHRFYNVTTKWRNVFLIPETFMLVFKWYVCYIDEFRSLFFSYLFSMFFVPRYTPFADRARSHAMFTMWDRNHQWRIVNPMSKNDEVRLLGLNLGLSRDVCEPMVGSAVKDSWWTNQEKLFCPLSQKTRRVQLLFYFNALSLPNHVCM